MAFAQQFINIPSMREYYMANRAPKRGNNFASALDSGLGLGLQLHGQSMERAARERALAAKEQFNQAMIALGKDRFAFEKEKYADEQAEKERLRGLAAGDVGTGAAPVTGPSPAVLPSAAGPVDPTTPSMALGAGLGIPGQYSNPEYLATIPGGAGQPAGTPSGTASGRSVEDIADRFAREGAAQAMIKGNAADALPFLERLDPRNKRLKKMAETGQDISLARQVIENEGAALKSAVEQFAGGEPLFRGGDATKNIVSNARSLYQLLQDRGFDQKTARDQTLGYIQDAMGPQNRSWLSEFTGTEGNRARTARILMEQLGAALGG